MNVTGVASVLYPVTDLPRALAFYERVLGLTPSRRFGDAGEGVVEYHLGSGTLSIQTDSGRRPSPDGGSVVLEVDDFDAALHRLHASGIACAVTPHHPPIDRRAAVVDPDGNTIYLQPRRADLGGPAIVHQ